MIIPHNEHGIRNLHISHFWIGLFSIFLFLSLFIASFYLIKHTIYAKEITRLTKFREINQTNLLLYEKGLAEYEKKLKSFNNEVQSIARISDKNNRRNKGIGGPDLDINDLSEPLKGFLDQQEIIKRENPWKNLERNKEYLAYAHELARNANEFIQKRRAFLFVFPTQWPVVNGLGAPIEAKDNSLVLELIGGTPVVASGKAFVYNIKCDSKELFSIILDHGFGIYSEYHHLVSVQVEEGDDVKKGAHLGLSSDKIKFRIRIASSYIDPLKYAVVRYN